MAIIKFINTKPSLKNLIEYVSNVEKTEHIAGKDCMAISCYEEMIATKKLYKNLTDRFPLNLSVLLSAGIDEHCKFCCDTETFKAHNLHLVFIFCMIVIGCHLK